MRRRISFVARSVLTMTVTLAGLFALNPAASALQETASACPTATDTPLVTGRSLAESRPHLLPRDGTGFFSTGVARVVVYTPDAQIEEAAVAAEDARRALRDFYGERDVLVEASSGSRLPEATPSTRVVIITGDLAVPGQPSVFTIGGAKTLYVHWTTASNDLGELLDVPAFEALGPVDRTIAATNCSTATAASTDTDTAAGAVDEAPDDVLAYVASDEEPAPPLVTVPTVPLADTASGDHWPLPVAGAALLVTAGGIVLHRRDKIFGERFSPAGAAGEIGLGQEQTLVRLPVADRPPAKPRVIYLDDDNPTEATTEPATSGLRREIDLQATRPESPLTRSVEQMAAAQRGPVLSAEDFAALINAEWSRRCRGGRDGAVASLVLSELDAVRLRLGPSAAEQLFDEVAARIVSLARPLDVVGVAGENELALLMPELDEDDAREALDDLAKAIAASSFSVGNERVLLTPATGFAMLSDTPTAPDLVRAVESARALSMLNLHLNPERWDGSAQPAAAEDSSNKTWGAIKERLRTPLQIAITVVLSWVIPFLTYFGLERLGLDISFAVYLTVVSALVITGAFILAEGFMAVKQKEPPELAPEDFPKASALIAAYLPNEAATVIETIEAFLHLDYPNEVQIILAYNTPDPLPVEEHLDRIAAEHPNFIPVRIVGSNSKAQNVNAALSMADGAFIGMFDADHQPRPDAFTRAWRWIHSGYDVVQGHCLTRNGDTNWLAKMIAVEFESIYTVAHPGRAKMHRFGVFGGSNGFWRTELLHETRMRGSMLTEDIDSSMRVIERGFKIRSDRDLVSRELATTTFTQVWNQRMRWAQGWFQVSLEHVKLSLRSKELTIRQKMGLFHLLMWREIYPWLSQQMIPLLAFWAVRAGGFEKLDWTVPIFVVTTLFTFSVGPLQTIFAYKLADDEIKQHRAWFWGYLLFTTPFYTEYKNLISRVAHIKQFMGESNWRVTPRSADPDTEL